MLKFQIGARLRATREELQMKQEDVASFLQTTVQRVSSFETGRTRVDIETLALLAGFFNVSADYLLCLTDEKQALYTSRITADEKKLIEANRELNHEGKGRLLEYADDLCKSGKYMEIKRS